MRSLDRARSRAASRAPRRPPRAPIRRDRAARREPEIVAQELPTRDDCHRFFGPHRRSVEHELLFGEGITPAAAATFDPSDAETASTGAAAVVTGDTPRSRALGLGLGAVESERGGGPENSAARETACHSFCGGKEPVLAFTSSTSMGSLASCSRKLLRMNSSCSALRRLIEMGRCLADLDVEVLRDRDLAGTEPVERSTVGRCWPHRPSAP